MTDRFVVRTVVLALAVAVITGVVTMALLSWAQLPIPDQFDRIVTYLAGVMSGFLISAKSAPGPDDLTDVNIAGQDDPVVTEDVKGNR